MRSLIIALLSVGALTLISCSSDQAPLTGAEKASTDAAPDPSGSFDQPTYGVFGSVAIGDHGLPQTVEIRCEDCGTWVGIGTVMSFTGNYAVTFTQAEAVAHDGHYMRAIWLWPDGCEDQFFTYTAPITGPIDFD
jgi:hypothetical protein